MNSKAKGNISEARVLFEFQKLGIPVSLPWGDNERYDCIIEIKKNLYKVQIKTANEEHNGSIQCYCKSSLNHTTNKNYTTYENDVDYFVFYNFSRDILAIVPIAEVSGQSTIALRVTPTVSNQKKGIRFFKNYSFEHILCVETLHEEPKE